MKILYSFLCSCFALFVAVTLEAQLRWSADETVRSGTGTDVKMGFNNTQIVAAIGSTRFMTWIRGDSLVVTSSQNGGAWSAPALAAKVNVLSANLPTIAALSDGKLCVGWTEGIGLRTSFSTDGGKTWAASQVLASGGSGLCLAAGQNGTLYALWHSGDETKSDVMFSSWQGGAWSAAKAIDTAPATSSAVWSSLSVSGNALYAVWRENTTGEFRVYFTRSANGGATWETPRNIVPQDHSGDPSVVVTGGSNVTVAYHNAQQVYTLTSGDGGATFNNAPKLVGPGLFARVIADQGFVGLVWERFMGSSKTDQIKQTGFVYSLDYGYNWSVDSAVSVMGSKLALASFTAPSELTITWLNTNNSGAVMAKRATLSSATAIRGGADAASTLALSITPNPTSEQTTVRFSLAQPEHVRLALYDVLGREVALLLDAELEAGEHTWSLVVSHWSLVDGSYFLRLQTPTLLLTKPIQVLQ